MATQTQALTIGKLAKRLGVTVDALRYYEKLGLLQSAERTASGYRLYRMDAADRIRFIRQAQALGFTLNEIGELLSLNDDRSRTAAEVKALVRDKIADIRGRIRSLERICDSLEELDCSCSGRGSTRECPILESLGSEENRGPMENPGWWNP